MKKQKSKKKHSIPERWFYCVESWGLGDLDHVLSNPTKDRSLAEALKAYLEKRDPYRQHGILTLVERFF